MADTIETLAGLVAVVALRASHCEAMLRQHAAVDPQSPGPGAGRDRVQGPARTWPGSGPGPFCNNIILNIMSNIILNNIIYNMKYYIIYNILYK